MFSEKPKKLTPAQIAEIAVADIARRVFAEEILKPETALAVIETVALNKTQLFRLKSLIETGSPRLHNEGKWTPVTRKVEK